MKLGTRFLAMALACSLLAGCGAVRTEPLTEEPPAQGDAIAYVPLDDRPDNVERVAYLAESLGYTLDMPEADWYQSRLDGQPLNENGTRRGDMGRLYQWVLDREAAGCDRYILSLDQLLSGGLVSSRCMTEDSITLPDGRAVSAAWLLEDLLGTLAADANNRVWLLDTVMRLAPTVGYAGGTVELYNWIRAFGAEPRETLEGAALNLESVLESYWYGPSGEELYDKVARAQGAVAADDYYGPYRELSNNMLARERKLRLSVETEELLAREGHEQFRLLIGIDDSSAQECIQKNEIALLRQGLRTAGAGALDWILSGVDDLAFKAVAKLYLDECGWTGGRALVQYFGGTEDQPACDYDFMSLREIVEEHFAFFNLLESEMADFFVLVLTQPAEESRKKSYYTQLIQQLKEYRAANRPVILIDAGNNRYGTAFHDALTKDAELGWLLSYAGFLDMAIVTGTAMSHGVARYAFLCNGEKTEASERAFARTLADSVIKDFCYRNVVREDILALVRDKLGGDPNNFYVPDIDRDQALALLEKGMAEKTRPVLKNLERSSFIASLTPYAEKGWGGVALENYRFPWNRSYEIDMEILLGEWTEPHERVLGIYYQ